MGTLISKLPLIFIVASKLSEVWQSYKNNLVQFFCPTWYFSIMWHKQKQKMKDNSSTRQHSKLQAMNLNRIVRTVEGQLTYNHQTSSFRWPKTDRQNTSTLQSLFHITSVIHRAITGLDIVLTAVIQVGLITGSSEVNALASQLVCFSQQHSVHPSRGRTCSRQHCAATSSRTPQSQHWSRVTSVLLNSFQQTQHICITNKLTAHMESWLTDRDVVSVLNVSVSRRFLERLVSVLKVERLGLVSVSRVWKNRTSRSRGFNVSVSSRSWRYNVSVS